MNHSLTGKPLEQIFGPKDPRLDPSLVIAVTLFLRLCSIKILVEIPRKLEPSDFRDPKRTLKSVSNDVNCKNRCSSVVLVSYLFRFVSRDFLLDSGPLPSASAFPLPPDL